MLFGLTKAIALSSSLLPKNLKIRIYKTIILNGCEIWSLTLREEHRLRVFENRVLGRIFVPKRDEVTGEWRKLHSKELHDLCFSPSIIRIILCFSPSIIRIIKSRKR
jgi:hypothetical protein